MMEYKDYLGIPIKVGDFVLAAANRGYLEKCIVIGYTPTMVRTSCGLYHSTCCMIATEQLKFAGYQEWMDKELAKYQSRLEQKIEKPKISWRYLVGILTDISTKNKFGCVMKLDGTTNERLRSSQSEWIRTNGYDPTTAYYLQQVYKGYPKHGYVEEFDKDYRRYDKGYSLSTVKIHGMQDCINNPMPLDQFIAQFTTFNLTELRSNGKI